MRSRLSCAGAPLVAAGITMAAAGQFCPGGNPQAALPMECGAGAATCFSGFVGGNPAGGVDPDGFVVAFVDFRDPVANSPGTGMHWCAPMFHNEFPVTPDTWSEKNLGQVFGITIDDANPPNIYVAATTTYGSDDPSYQNVNTQAFSAPSFGPGGAGAVYRLSGTTGAISILATLPNTGPGLGNLCFDRSFGSFYVSNFEDGRIYRLSSAGACLSTFDHITDTVGSCAPEAGDPAGFVPFRERVWAVKTFGDRLYYSLWNEDRGRPNGAVQNEVWSVGLDGAGQFIAGTSQLEISVPDFSSTEGPWSNPVSDISFSAAGRMMLAERNMLADVGPGARPASAADGHRSRNLEYELTGSVWGASGRDFFIGETPSGPGTNSAGGIDYDCDDNLWSTGDQLLLGGNPPGATYGLQRTPEAGNTIPTIATTGYFIDLDGISTVQNKNKIGDVVVYNACCTCMTAVVDEITCDVDPATGLTGKYTVTMTITNNSGVTASYVLLPGDLTQPNIVPLVPPLPSGTGETRTITFQLCDLEPGTSPCFYVVLADANVEECCSLEVCVDLPECDCLQFTELVVDCLIPGNDISVSFTIANLTNDFIEHVFIFKPQPPDPNAGITVTPDYVDLTGSPIPPFGSASIGPFVISGAVPGSTLCLLVSGHNADLVECCSEELCFTVPECGMPAVGACCLPDGTCVLTTLADCQMQQGLYLGDDSGCDECDSLEPRGACCFSDGTCVIVSLFECGNLGGMYAGDDTTCDECDVMPPLGACCLEDGTCVIISAGGCANQGGTFLGAGTDCDECGGGQVDGACCLPGGGCTITLQADCKAQGGVFQGGGTTCDDCPAGFSPCDIDQNGSIGFSDLLILLSNWGPCPGCPADVNEDGVVDFADLLLVLSQWG